MERFGKVIPFYGASNPRLFEIERRCMDRDHRVIAYLDTLLPAGLILDIGAGTGFTATFLMRAGRSVIPLEPAGDMIDHRRQLLWVQGVAQELPFASQVFSAAYATWAYFFPGSGYGAEGLREVHRVVKRNGPIVMIDNAGDDEFCGLYERNIASDPTWWQARGFERQLVHTAFRFDSLTEADELLSWYWQVNGRRAGSIVKTEVEYKVAVYIGRSQGG